MLNLKSKYKTSVFKSSWLLIWHREEGRTLTVSHWDNEHHCPTVTLGASTLISKCILLLLLKFPRVPTSAVPWSRIQKCPLPGTCLASLSLSSYLSYIVSPWGHPFLITCSNYNLRSSLFLLTMSLHGNITVFLFNCHILHLLRMGDWICYSIAISPVPHNTRVQCNIISEEMRRLPSVQRESHTTQGLGFIHKASITLVEVLSLLCLPFSRNCSSRFLAAGMGWRASQLILKFTTLFQRGSVPG